MNIFYLHPNPMEAPRYLYNKHSVKMVLETAQILCTAHQVLAEETGVNTDYIPYRKAYYNHPSCVWARKSKANYDWLFSYFASISIEYFTRYDRIHQSWIRCRHLSKAPVGIPRVNFTQPPQCMPEEFHNKCSVKAYWDYYINDKKHIAENTEDVISVNPYAEIKKNSIFVDATSI